MLLRQKLFLVLALMALVPLLFLLFGVVGRIETDLENSTQEEIQKSLSKLSQELSTLMDNQKAVVRGLARVPVVRDFAMTLADTRDEQVYEEKVTNLMAFFLNYQATVPSIQAIRFTDMQGKALVKIKEGHLIPNNKRVKNGKPYVEDIAYKPFFSRAIKTDSDVSISDFERGKVSGEVDFCPAMVRYSVPIRDELDSPYGLLIVNMWGKRIDDAVEAALGGYPGHAYIAEITPDKNRDGIYLYHRDADKRFSNQLATEAKFSTDVGDEQWKRIKDGDQTGMVTRAENNYYYFKFSPYPDRPTHWLLVIEMARDSVLAPIIDLKNWIVYLILFVVLISIAIAHWAASRLAKPVHELAQIIRNYADGDRQVKYKDERKDEIGYAGKAFNYLVNKVEKAEKERIKAELSARQSERLAAVGQMAAGIGHEINNPLMNIMSLAALIDEGVPDDNRQMKEDINALQKEGQRCARIVQGVLNFARENKPKFVEFDYNNLLEETRAIFEHRLRTSNVQLVLDVSKPLVMQGDPNQLQQVLVNVIINALHASQPGSEIRIVAKEVGNSIVTQVLDSGNGMTDDNLAKAFSPFFTTKSEGSGTGLGLSVSYGIIRKHGGTIILENRPEGGVKVEISLPKAHKQSTPRIEAIDSEVGHAS